MIRDTQKIQRTMRLTTVGSRFEEGPVAVNGYTIASVEIVERTSTAMGTGAIEIKYSLSGSTYHSFVSAVNLSTSVRVQQEIGASSQNSIRAIEMIDGFCTVAQSGAVIDVYIYLVALDA